MTATAERVMPQDIYPQANEHAAQVFSQATLKDDPYRYWLFEDALPLALCRAIVALPIPSPGEYDSLGKRDTRNDLRRFVSPEMQKEFPEFAALADIFHEKKVINALETLCDVSFDESYLRIEYCQDSNGFWLEPHMDIKEKRITIQIYLNEGEGAETLGTDIYYPDKSHYGTAPSLINQGMVFVPKEPLSYHGFTKRPIKGVRKSLIINYVNDDWRSRHELAFPDQKVSSK